MNLSSLLLYGGGALLLLVILNELRMGRTPISQRLEGIPLFMGFIGFVLGAIGLVLKMFGI